MGIKMPDSMDQCVYFTNRTLGDNGKAIAWAYKLECPKCKKGRMGKPVEKGKIRIRATEYVCPECGYTEEKAEHEAKLKVEIDYVCPECGKKGEAVTEYKRKSWQGVKAFVFTCEGCGANLGVTKKMKKPKKKKVKAAEADVPDDI